MPPVFDMDNCTMCGTCVDDCPGYILKMADDGPSVEFPHQCWHCGNCKISCPADCVTYEFPLNMMV